MDDQTTPPGRDFAYPTPYPTPRDKGSSAGTSPSRRAVLVAGGVLVVAAAGGVGLGGATGRSHRGPLVAELSDELVAAAAAERALVATADAALTGAATTARAHLRLVRADHTAHLAALEAAIAVAAYPAAVPSTGPASSTTPAGTPTLAAVRSAERAAATAAAARAERLDGADATLLASIAAAEASHAELLS